MSWHLPIILATAFFADDAKDGVKVLSNRDGFLLVIGREVQEGDVAPAEEIVRVHADNIVRHYREWKTGDRVKKGELLARLGDEEACRRKSAWEAIVQSFKARRDALTIPSRLEEMSFALALLRVPVREGDEDLQQIQLAPRSPFEALRRKAAEELLLAQRKTAEELLLAQGQLDLAVMDLQAAEIRSPTDGVIAKIHRYPDNRIRRGDLLFEILPK